MPLIPLDVKRCPDFYAWNLSDQLELCPGGPKRPLLQMKNSSGNKLPNLQFCNLSIRRIISEHSKATSSTNNEDRIPIDDRPS